MRMAQGRGARSISLRPAVLAALLSCLLWAAGCTTVHESAPRRTATEQLLVSTAADRAVERLDLNLPDGTKVFVDDKGFRGQDSWYAVAAVRDRLLRSGVHLVNERGAAEAVVELRGGALSIDERETLVGIPAFDVPIPLAGALGFPEIALFKEKERKGVAKIAATSYGAADGGLIDSTGPQFGYSHEEEWLVLLFSWRDSDVPREETLGLESP